MGKVIKGRLTQKRFKALSKEDKQTIKSEAERFGLVYGTPKELKQGRKWKAKAINRQLTKYKRLLSGQLQKKYLTTFGNNFKSILGNLGGNTKQIDRLISTRTRREQLDDLSKLFPEDLKPYMLYYKEGKMYDEFKGTSTITEKINELYANIKLAYNIKDDEVFEKMGIDPKALGIETKQIYNGKEIDNETMDYLLANGYADLELDDEDLGFE